MRHWLAQYSRHLRRMRKEHQLTLEQLAEAIDLSSKYLSEVERAEKAPSFRTMAVLADYFGSSIGSFFDLEEDEVRQIVRKVEEVLRVH